MVETLGRAGLYEMTKEVPFELLFFSCPFQIFLTWYDTFPVYFFFKKVAPVTSLFQKVYKFIAAFTSKSMWSSFRYF